MASKINKPVNVVGEVHVVPGVRRSNQQPWDDHGIRVHGQDGIGHDLGEETLVLHMFASTCEAFFYLRRSQTGM